MTRYVELNNNEIDFEVERDNEIIHLKLVPEKSNIIKTGLYLKDKISGVGTLTYIDPNTKIFGSLGHQIIENKTAKKFEIKDGKIYEATINSIVKSKVGSAGEKNATFNKEEPSGTITENKISGIYGEYKENIENKQTLEVATIDEIKLGKAKIKTELENNEIQEFEINILNINKNSETKNILFEVTDKNLLNKTGGIIQGMSGSPIIQNNKIIGAVNYVILNDPTKGYAIFITKMLEEGER